LASLLLALTVSKLSSLEKTLLTAVTEARMFLKVKSFLAVQIPQQRRMTRIRGLMHDKTSRKLESWP
jgi:hypothetical protein